MGLFDFMDQQQLDINGPQATEPPWMSKCVLELVTEETLDACIATCIASGRYALDLETTGLDTRVIDGVTVDKIVGYCLSPDGVRGYYIPVRHQKGVEHNIRPSLVYAAIQRLVKSPSVAIFHNAKFDQAFLQWNGGEPMGEWDSPSSFECTLILAYLENSKSVRIGLKYLAETRLGLKMVELDELYDRDYKGDKDFSLLSPAGHGVLWYTCGDAICTYRLFELLHPLVVAPEGGHGQSQAVVYTIEKMCVPANRWMEQSRIKLDPVKIEELIKLGQAEEWSAVISVLDGASKLLKRDVTPGWCQVLKGNLPEGMTSYVQPYDPNDMTVWFMDRVQEARAEAARLQLDPQEVHPQTQKPRLATIQKTVAKLVWQQGEERMEVVDFPLVYDPMKPATLGLMFREMGVQGLKATDKSGQVQTSKEELERVIAEAGDKFPFMGLVKRFRETHKALSTYLIPMYEDRWASKPDGTGGDDTIRINYNPTKTDTGRFSTPGAKKRGSGGLHGGTRLNLHGLPATYDPNRPQCMTRIRECVVSRHHPDGTRMVLVACVAEGSLISTNRGLVPIQEVTPGDTVLTENGFQEVTDARKTGFRDTLLLVSEKGYQVQVTPDHLVRTVGDDGFCWKPAGDLVPGDWLVSLIGAPTSLNSRLPGCPDISPWETQIRVPDSISVDLAELLGRFMGDGCIGHEHGKARYVGFALGSDLDVLPELNRKASSLFGVVFTHKGKGDVVKWSQPLARWFEEATHKGSSSVQEYQVPPCVLQSDQAIWAGFLRGLFDADGSVGSRPGDGVSAWVSSDQMAQEVQLLLLGLGIPCRRNRMVRETNFGVNDGWFLTITGIGPLARFAECVGMLSPRKCQELLLLSSHTMQKDQSNRIPLALAAKAVPRKRNLLTNRVHTNGRRHGQVTRQALERCLTHPEDLDPDWMHTLLNGSFRFDRVVNIKEAGSTDVYDLTVPGAGHFQAGGIVVHNCDFSGQELRIATNISREPKWITEFFRCSSCDMKFDRGDGKSMPQPPPPFCPRCGSDKIGDLHTLTAQNIFGADVMSTPEGKQRRQESKGVNFAVVYGGGPDAVQAACKCSKEEGTRIKRQYDESYKTLINAQKAQVAFAQKHGYAITAFGRRCPLPDLNMPRRDPVTGRPNWMFISKAQRNAVNHPVQGTGGDIGKLAMALCYKMAKKHGWLKKGLIHMPITIHDELVFEIHPSILAEALPILTKNMAWETVKKLPWPVPLTLDVEAGYDWTTPWNITKMQHGKKPWAPELKGIFEIEGAPSEKPKEGATALPETSIPEKPEPAKLLTGAAHEVVVPREKLSTTFGLQLAEAILRCQGRGTHPLVIRTSDGESLLDREIHVAPMEFAEAMAKIGLT